MMNKPLVSCISPCYKMEKYLKLFLDELPKQTIFNKIEIVLDHNEPTEQEIIWIKEFQEKYPNRLKHIVTNPKIFIGPSMNKCISYSSSDYLTLWNVDDLRCKDSIENQYNCMIETEADIVHGNFIIVNNFGSKKGKLIDHSQYVNDHPELKRGMVYGPFFMWKKKLTNIWFDEQLKTGADYEFCMRLSRLTKKIRHVPQILGYYLDEGLGASTRGDNLQPTERTVVELRYNLLDKIDERFLTYAKKYDIENIVFENKKINIKNFLV